MRARVSLALLSVRKNGGLLVVYLRACADIQFPKTRTHADERNRMKFRLTKNSISYASKEKWETCEGEQKIIIIGVGKGR